MGMLSYIMGHNKPDIAYALNVLSLYCNKPGRCHVEFLLCFVNYYDYSKDDRFKYHVHPVLYDAQTMRGLTQAAMLTLQVILITCISGTLVIAW